MAEVSKGMRYFLYGATCALVTFYGTLAYRGSKAPSRPADPRLVQAIQDLTDTDVEKVFTLRVNSSKDEKKRSKEADKALQDWKNEDWLMDDKPEEADNSRKD